MTSEPSPTEAWDAEYAAGRYASEPPVPFTRDILAAARQAGLSTLIVPLRRPSATGSGLVTRFAHHDDVTSSLPWSL